jgi:hypothetical protein
VSFHLTSGGAHHLGTVRRLSLRGAFIETGVPVAFGTPVIVRATLSGLDVVLPAIVRWSDASGIAVHFAQLGARETYAITAAIKRAA